MSQNRGLSSSDLEQVKQIFISYLEGSAPSMFLGEALNVVLRVEEPIYFAPKDVAQIVATWALLRSHSDGYLVHEYYIRSIELIAAADHSKILNAFEPTRFFMPYFEGLVRTCPKEEKEAFRNQLKQLREKLASEWGYQFRRTDAAASQEVVSVSSFPSEPTTSFSVKQPNPNKYIAPEEPVNNYPVDVHTSFSSSSNLNPVVKESFPTYPPSNITEPPSTNYPISPPSVNYPANPNTSFSEQNPSVSYPGLNPSTSYPGLNPNTSYPGLNPSTSYPGLNPNTSYPGLNTSGYSVSPYSTPIAEPPAGYPYSAPIAEPPAGYPYSTPSTPIAEPPVGYPYSTPIAEPPAGYPYSAPNPNYPSNTNKLPTSWSGQANPNSAIAKPPSTINVNNLSINEVVFDMDQSNQGNGNYDNPNYSQAQNYGQQKATPEVVSSVLHRLRMSIFKLSSQDQDNYVAEIQRLLFEMLQKRVYLTPYLEAVVDISINTFNANQGVFGAQLLYIVEQIYYSEGFDTNIRSGLRRFRAATELNEQYMRSMASHPDLAPALRIYLAHFDELAPDVLLSSLFCETDRQKQRLWMLLIETHKETATGYIIQGLSQVTPSPENWPAIKNLIALLGRIPPQERLAQRQAISVLGPYLKSPYVQLRYATLTTLESFITDETLPHLIAIFDEKLYADTELEDPDRLLAYLKTVLTLLGKFNSERAVKLLAEIAIGKYISFINAKSIQNLQLQAMQLLTSKRNLLSSNVIVPIIEKIRNVTNPWKKLLTSKFWSGDDEMELLAMIEVVGMFNTPEIRELLTDIKDRYANQPPGRRANEILARL